MVIFGEDFLERIISDVRGRHQVDELIDLAQYVPIVITRIAGKIRVVELHDPPPFVSSGLHTNTHSTICNAKPRSTTPLTRLGYDPVT